LLLASCGGPLPGEAVAVASALARDQGSAKVFMKTSSSFAMGEFTMEGNGEIDFANKLGHMTMVPSGAAVEQAGGMLGEIEAVFSDLVVYMRMDSLEQFLPQGKRWIKIDMQAVGEDMGFDFAQLQQLGQSDPSQQLDFLKGVSDVEEAGTEEVRGVETTRYSGTLDYDKVAAEFPEAAESIKRIQELTGMATSPISVWLDGDGLPRRVSYTMTMKPPADSPAAGSAGTSTFVMEYYDYGTDVQVEIPPESETLDPSQLQG
jgi:hypothetical protein